VATQKSINQTRNALNSGLLVSAIKGQLNWWRFDQKKKGRWLPSSWKLSKEKEWVPGCQEMTFDEILSYIYRAGR
jgi:hypothetical protein